MFQKEKVGFIFLAGGQGLRFGGATPKQYQHLQGRPLALYAFHTFQQCSEIDEFVVVCAEEFQPLFLSEASRDIKFSSPGNRRQDSVENGFKALTKDVEIISIHDSARPFSTILMLKQVLEAAQIHGASAVGMPIKNTLKECNENGIVVQTLNRSRCWEIQTPQALRYSVLKNGLEIAGNEGLMVTDDTTLAELNGTPVKIVEGSYSNIKITTPEDLIAAELLYANV